jgi:hypothetical protein
MGIDVDRTIALTFLLGGLLAGASGVLYALVNTTTVWNAGFKNGMFAFTRETFTKESIDERLHPVVDLALEELSPMWSNTPRKPAPGCGSTSGRCPTG